MPGVAETAQIRQLALQLAAVGPVAEAAARAIIRTGANASYSGSRDIVPVLTGHLRSTIYMREDRDGLGWETGADADYASYIENGTSRMAPQPFILPPFEQAVQITEFALNTMIMRYL